MAQADVNEVEKVIWTIGFHHNKARNCVNCARMIMSDFGGEVPQSMEELQKLPGVGRKTANIVMNECFDKVEGIAVDTHVFRIAHRLRFSAKKTPGEVERDLLSLLPKGLWKNVNSHALAGNIASPASPAVRTAPALTCAPRGQIWTSQRNRRYRAKIIFLVWGHTRVIIIL